VSADLGRLLLRLSENCVRFPDMAARMTTVHDQILARIRARARGSVFIPKDFLDLGSRDAADQALSRLAKLGAIQRLGRGLYLYPRNGVSAASVLQLHFLTSFHAVLAE
jgi:predicted transcriptional regulator of viral defense system